MNGTLEQTQLVGTREPYPGPRPFKQSETSLFFGRERETAQLRSLVLAHSLVLLYARSGAGKTSLLRAGLIPALESRDATVYPILRIRPPGREHAATGVENPYVRSLVANWSVQQEERAPELRSFKDFVEFLSRAYGANEDEPRLLIIDQFEELFTDFPEYWQERGDFFAELQAALDTDPELRILLAIREDYLPQTDPYAADVSNHLQHRYRIDRLSRDAALAAISGPLSLTDRSFASGAGEYLIDQLLQIRVERDGHAVAIPGEYVEPVQLQIVCAWLWERLESLPERVIRITKDHIDRYVPVDRALARFYGDVVGRVAAKVEISPFDLRRWCEERLITPGGTRALVYRGSSDTAGLPNAAIDELESEHLIRGEERAGAHWYELSHDKFIEAIQSGNRQAFEEQAESFSDFDARTDEWSKRVAEVIRELRGSDRDGQATALQGLLPVVLGSAPLSPDLWPAFKSALADVAEDQTAGEAVRRVAEQLQALAQHSEGALESRLSSRRTAAYVRYLSVKGRVLLVDVLILAGGLVASLISLDAATAAIRGWGFFDGLDQWLAVGIVAAIWTFVYTYETLDNFPLPSWRRSEHQSIHTLTSPFAPYLGASGLERLKLLVGWPLNLCLPWGAATGSGLLADEVLGVQFSPVFYAIFGIASALAAWAYLENEL